MKTETPRSLRMRLLALTVARLFLNTGLRFVYPYTPAIARGLAVERESIYALIALRNAMGFLSPAISPVAERFGSRTVLLGGMLVFSLGCLVVVLWPVLWALGLTLILMGLAKITYDPAMQAFLGDTVPYARRGRALAFTEYSWALALLVGAPLAGLAMQRQGWQAPFFWLALLAAASMFFLKWAIPGGRPLDLGQVSLRGIVAIIRANPVVVSAVVYVTFLVMANEMLFIVFGAWMEDSFQLNLSALGAAAAVIGVAELLGETVAGWAVDRFEKRRVTIVTGALNACFYLLLPYLGQSLVPALTMLFLIFLTFEITVVGGIPLMTQLVPTARTLVMSMVIAAMSLGRVLGALAGPLVWSTVGFKGNGWIWASIMLLAVLILALWIREAPEARPQPER